MSFGTMTLKKLILKIVSVPYVRDVLWDSIYPKTRPVKTGMFQSLT
jgi:hypothetical protein